ncbi:MAG: hypothetical protein ACI33S_03190 [Bacilli bacterium]
MAIIRTDIEKTRTLISEFDLSVQNYKNAVDSFFKKIQEYNGWEGDAANKYLETVKAESIKYVNMGESLQSFSSLLSDITDNLETTVSKTAK